MLGRIRQVQVVTLFALLGAAVFVSLALATGRMRRPPAVSDGAALARDPAPVSSAPQPPDSASAPAGEAGTPAPDPSALLPARATSAASASPTGASGRVGILPGHWQYDTGAVCPDGLREVEVTTDVALRVKALLEYRGLAVDLLPEHDPTRPQPPLQNYRGAALVAIHADSCDFPAASGFKVARWRFSRMPDTEDRLVDCLEAAYARHTLLPEHPDTITPNMWNYYAFREIAVDTPAAIIELGFLGGDRAFIDAHRYEMARGIAEGIGCFLDRRGDG